MQLYVFILNQYHQKSETRQIHSIISSTNHTLDMDTFKLLIKLFERL